MGTGRIMGPGATEMAIQRLAVVRRSSLGHCQRRRQNGIGAELPLVVGAVQGNQPIIDGTLVVGLQAEQRFPDRAVDVGDGLEHALAHVALGSPSRNSIASRVPVEAPEGAAARPNAPESRTTSASMVGLPRESRISRAVIDLIFAIFESVPILSKNRQLQAFLNNPREPARYPVSKGPFPGNHLP